MYNSMAGLLAKPPYVSGTVLSVERRRLRSGASFKEGMQTCVNTTVLIYMRT